MKKLLMLILSFSFPCLLFAQNMELNYKIYDTKKAKFISIGDLIRDIKNVDVLFFGEEHNDSTGHFLERKIFSDMLQAYPKTALTMEMFCTDVQPVIDEYLAGCISEKNFIKEARAWNNYNDYKPLIELAKTSKVPVIAGNAAVRYSNAVTTDGLESLNNLPAASKTFLPPLPVDTLTGPYYKKFTKMLGSHNMGNMKIYQTQNLWDATMAWSIAKYLKNNKEFKVLQLNGRFHSDEGLGTLEQLKKMNPKLRIANISCFSAEDFSNPDWGKHKGLGDYIMITNPDLKRTF